MGRDVLRPLALSAAERLRAAITGPPPSLTLFTGGPGTGKTEAITHATGQTRVARYWAAPLADPDHRELLVARLGAWAEAPEHPAPSVRSRPAAPRAPLSPTSDWPRIFEHLALRAAERRGTLRLVLEEFPRLVEARSKLPLELERFWARVRGQGLPVHLVLAGREGPVFASLRATEPLAGWIGEDIPVGPLGFREVAALFSGYAPRDRLLAWLIFGGHPRHLGPCDPGVSLATNVRQVLLSPDSPLVHEGTNRLRFDLQSPGRYASLLASIAAGGGEWARILAGSRAFGSGGQMAPYLSRLQELGLVTTETSLDAAPGSRQRRYRIAEPFFAFWYRFVLPNLTDILAGRGRDVWRSAVRPGLEVHAAGWFPQACRAWLAEHARARLGSNAREVGGLWGPDYDIEPAGTLASGAVFYGRAFWGGERVPEAADEALVAEIGRTRFGFGRERRIRFVFATAGFSPELVRRAARTDLLHLVGLDEMLGG